MTTEFDAFRSVNFDWTRQLRSIWRDPPYHVALLHRARLDDLVDYFTRKTREPDPAGHHRNRDSDRCRRRAFYAAAQRH